MSRIDTLVSAGAWEVMVRNLKALGPNPVTSEVMEIVITALWETECITLDEDHR